MRFIWIILVLNLVQCENIECVHDPSLAGRCLRPLLDVWEAIRETETIARDLLFPVPFYSKIAVHKLCASYITVTDECSANDQMLKCPPDPIIQFVDSHLKFVCGQYGPAVMDNFDCVSKSLLELQHCREHIRGVPNPMQNSRKCDGMATFFDCIKDRLNLECGEIATSLLGASIEELGCLDGTTKYNDVLKQVNSTDMLTEQFRRDYFKNAQKMELKIPSIKAARTYEDYPKMPEIAFAKDEKNMKKELVTTSIEDEEDNATKPTQFMDSTESTTMAASGTLEVVASTPSESTTKESFNDAVEDDTSSEELQVTNEVVETTTHPPYCIPHRDHLTISNCYKGVMAKAALLSAGSPATATIHFPLYNVSVEDVIALCDDTRDATKCMDGVDKFCLHPQLNFVEQQFLATCELLKMRDFDIDYTCIQKKLLEREDCVTYVNGTMDPSEDKCEGQETFLSCMKAELEQECGEESYNSVVTMLRGYGCNISDEIVAWNTSTILHTTTTSYKIASATKTTSTTQKIYQATTLPPSSFSSSVVEGSGTTFDTEPTSSIPLINDSSKKVHELLNLQNNFLATTAVNFGTTPAQGIVSVAGNDNEIGPGTLLEDNLAELSTSTEKEESVNEVEEDSPLFNYTVSSNCTSTMREHARVCTAPLMRTWAALRATWPHLAEVTFPVYKYSRVQLLELCDSYANVFLCANIDDIRVCLMDELVRFAQDHLGYICSPQNIQRFMGHYDCIMEQEALGKDNCRRHIIGEAVPGRDEYKCHGVKSYSSCLAPHLMRNCGQEALREFDASVRQFGCQSGLLQD